MKLSFYSAGGETTNDIFWNTKKSTTGGNAAKIAPAAKTLGVEFLKSVTKLLRPSAKVVSLLCKEASKKLGIITSPTGLRS